MVPARNLAGYNVKFQGIIISCAIKRNCFAALSGQKLLGNVVHDGINGPHESSFAKKVGLLLWNNVMWDLMLMDQTLYKTSNSSNGWAPSSCQGKLILKICDKFSQNESWSLWRMVRLHYSGRTFSNSVAGWVLICYVSVIGPLNSHQQ